MKQTFYCITAMFFTMTVFAQRGEDIQERIEVAKIGFISKEVALTTAEAQIFWPLYNEYQEALRKTDKPNFMEPRKNKEASEKMTDEEALAMLQKMEAMAEKREAIRKKYQAKFLTVLPPRKVLALYHAEHAFQRHLTERLQERNDAEKRPQGPGRAGQRPLGRPLPPPPSMD